MPPPVSPGSPQWTRLLLEGIAGGAVTWTKMLLASDLGIASGVAALDAASKVPTVNLGGSGASASNYLCGDQTWKTPAGAGEVAMSNRLPAGTITVATGYGATVVGDYEIASGYILDLSSNSVLEIS